MADLSGADLLIISKMQPFPDQNTSKQQSGAGKHSEVPDSSSDLNLKWGRVDLGPRLIHVVRTKPGKDRVIPVNDALFDVFGEKRMGCAGEFVFENPETWNPFRSIRLQINLGYKMDEKFFYRT